MKRTSVQNKKRGITKLSLRRETVRTLDEPALAAVVGGEEPKCNSIALSGCLALRVDGGAPVK